MNNDIKNIITKSLEEAKKDRQEIEIVNRFYITLFKNNIVKNLSDYIIGKDLDEFKKIIEENIDTYIKNYNSFEQSAIKEATSIVIYNNFLELNHKFNETKIELM